MENKPGCCSPPPVQAWGCESCKLCLLLTLKPSGVSCRSGWPCCCGGGAPNLGGSDIRHWDVDCWKLRSGWIRWLLSCIPLAVRLCTLGPCSGAGTGQAHSSRVLLHPKVVTPLPPPVVWGSSGGGMQLPPQSHGGTGDAQRSHLRPASL